MKIFTVLVLVVGLSGCIVSSGVREEIEDTVKSLHDDQLDVGEALVCGSSIRAFLSRYAGDPERMRDAVRFCGWYDYFVMMAPKNGELK